jgi:diadenosine tetraphosphate (Ap4A) HIT family hydrolase
MDDCIFCKIVKRELPAHVIWENDTHMAFLSRWPNTEGFSVVIPKKHFSSYLFDNDNEVITGLTLASKEVAKLIDAAFEDVGRTGMIFEGFGVDHLHAKLFPMHGTSEIKEWQKFKSNINTYFEKYPGYISSHDSKEVSDEELAKVADKIRGLK